ncbi:BLUF domain-containing protein [Larkinella insperata]|uniref:BLUF domain-containing protein n=1 Tax=Larkinella insperata TaxID=332158 RepID=A0ABW3QD57_9BACT
MEHCIVYLSYLRPQVNESELVRLLTQSRQNNQQAGITGVMLSVRGSILQVLEGPKQTVEALYHRIQSDNRHFKISTVVDRPIQQRLFADMAMGYETISSQQLDQIRSLVDLEQPDGLDRQSQDALLLRTIRLFYQSNRFN